MSPQRRGPGGWKGELDETNESWLLSDPLIRHEVRAWPDDLRMITADGDAMEPLLSSDDRILIDATQKVPVSPSSFVIRDGMGLVARRNEPLLSMATSGTFSMAIDTYYARAELAGDGAVARFYGEE